MSLWNAAVLLPLVALALLGVRVTRLLVWSPLAKVPGPKLYALTDWFYLYYLLRGEWTAKLKSLHDKYGPTLRFAPDEVSSIAPEVWKTVYGHKTSSDKLFEKDFTFLARPANGVRHLTQASQEDHRRMRRVLAHAFSEKALRAQEDIIQKYVDIFISKMAENAGKPVDIIRWFNYTTFDLIGDLAFGKPLGCLDGGPYNAWVAMVFSIAKYGVKTRAIRRHPWLGLIKSWIVSPKLERDFIHQAALSEKTAFERIEHGNAERNDFMDYVLRHNDEKGLTKPEIASNASLLIGAGSETTATQMSGLTFYLLTNRDKYDKLVREIRERFALEEEINMTSVNNLPYLSAALNEGFRMYPPVPIGLPRITPAGGETIDGYFIPQNTKVSLPQWSAYQSELNWTDPTRYVPERWLGIDSRYDDDKREVLQPFSFGPRNCIGKNLAYAELRVIMTRLLWGFDLELLPESRNWTQQPVFFLWEKPALMVKLTKVQRA